MARSLFKKTKTLTFDRTYAAAPEKVWQAWTDPELLRRWWGPEGTEVVECEVDLQVGGQLSLVMEAGESMGKYQGTRWPMAGTFTTIDPVTLLTYDARSWTAGEEEGTTIEHTNTITFAEDGGSTKVLLTIEMTRIGPKAKMAAFGMKWGYKAQLDKLADVLAG